MEYLPFTCKNANLENTSDGVQFETVSDRIISAVHCTARLRPASLLLVLILNCPTRQLVLVLSQS